MRNSLTLLNENGDTSISWDEENDEKMIALIQKKMDEGMTFFIIEPRFFNLIPMKIKLTNAQDALKKRSVFLKDADFNEIIVNGVATPYKRVSSGEINTTRVVTNAKEVVTNHVVGVGQRKGG